MRSSGNDFLDLCTTLGLMTLSWAWAESVLAMTIGVISTSAGPIKGYQEAPVSLKKKVSCFRIALRDITALQPLQKEGRVLAERFTDLSKRRNDLIHSAAWKHHEGSFEAIGVAVNRGDYVVKSHRFHISDAVSDAVSLEVEIAKLSDDADAFMTRVCNIFNK